MQEIFGRGTRPRKKEPLSLVRLETPTGIVGMMEAWEMTGSDIVGHVGYHHSWSITAPKWITKNI